MTPGTVARALAIALVLPLSGCVLVIGTSPTPLSEAQIIVIVGTDDSGTAVDKAEIAETGLTHSPTRRTRISD